MQAVTRVKLEQAPKVTMWMSTQLALVYGGFRRPYQLMRLRFLDRIKDQTNMSTAKWDLYGSEKFTS